jgi:geranylgeranyl diphosphate synthase type I
MTTIEATRSARTATEVIAWSRETVDPALRAAVGDLPHSMRRVAEYHFGWRDERGEPVPEGHAGKAIRPALTLLTADALGAAPGIAVPGAVAVELVHNFSLLHDDVMDGDLTRRHRPTAWTVFGVNSAILAGDSLLTLAFDVLNRSGHPRAPEAGRLLGGAVHRLLDGQSSDLEFEGRNRVELAECVRMSESKTGALLGSASALGAVFAGAPTPEPFARFGERLGLAFQFVDDLLGIWGDPEVTGKPVFSDLVNRKKSLPVVRALATGGAAGTALAELYAGDSALSPVDLAEAAGLIDASGARAWSRERADELLEDALTGLREAGVSARGLAELTALAELTVRRDH